MRQRPMIGPAVIAAAVALLAGVASALGVFARGDGTFVTVTSARGVSYEMATTGVYAYNSQPVVAEGVGWDVFTLFVAVPALLLAVPLVWRGSIRGRLFAAGLLAYFFYQYLEYSVGWAFGPLFPLFVGIYAASLAGLVWIGVTLAREDLGSLFDDGYPRRAFAALNVTLAGLLTLLWAQRISLGLAGELQAAGLYGETTMVVQALDLGLVVPVTLFVAFLVWRASTAGYVLAAVHVVAAVAMAAAIMGMVISAGIQVGSFEAPPLLLFAVYVALASLIGVRIYRAAGAPAERRGSPRHQRAAATAAVRP